MLRLCKELYNRPVLSLRSGTPIAITTRPIINPNNLQIIGWWCKASDSRESEILLTEYVREELEEGLVIDDLSSMSTPEDLLRHQEILNNDFALLEKDVRTKRKKIGKVEDYAYNEGYFVQKLYVGQPLIKALTADSHIVDRTQIIEITDTYILVRDTEVLANDKLRSHNPLPKSVIPAAGASPIDQE